MKALREGIAVVSTLLYSVLVAAQTAPDRGSTNSTNIPSHDQSSFPIPANSSSIATDSVHSTVLLGTGATGSNTSVTIPPSLSDTDIPPRETSTGTSLSSNSSIMPTNRSSLPDSRSILTETHSSPNSSVVPSDSVTASPRNSSAVRESSTEVITNGPSSTQLSGISKESSASDGVGLPPGITLPSNPPTTLLTTGTEIQSSASDFSIIFVGVFPLIQNWINHPDAPEITAVTNELNNILPKATDFLNKLPKPTGGVEPCKSKGRRSEPGQAAHQITDKRGLLGDLFKTAFSLVSCVIDTTNKVKDVVIKGTTDVVETVKNLQDDLKPMVDALNEVDPNEDSEPSGSASEEPSSTQSESTSSSSCKPRTASNCNIACTAIATTTLGGLSKRAEDNACRTVCGEIITGCSATGHTSASTVTSTSTTYQLCGPDCPGCNGSNRKLPTDVPDLGGYSKASNGVLYMPAPTVTALDDDTPAAKVRGLMPKETGSSSSHHLKRGLTHPSDPDWSGNVGLWLLTQVILSPNDLVHSHPDTTGFTFWLDNQPNTWSLKNLYGCTSVIVISRKRMFMTHIWENPTMLTPEHLQPEVLDTLRNGNAAIPGVLQGLSAFTGPGGDFENTRDNKVRAFIITPYRRGIANPSHDDLHYPYEVGKIKDMLKDVLGRSDTMVIPYFALGPDEYDLWPFGKVFIQYDPVAAWLSPADGSCNTQIAGIELWFEDNPTYRYRDRWTPFANQRLPANNLPRRSVSTDGKDARWLRGREVTEVDEEEWKEYETLMKRQRGDSCPLRSKSASASSISPSSSIEHKPSTLQTSLVSLSSGGVTTSSDEPPSSKGKPSSSTEKPFHETKGPPPSTGNAPSSTEKPFFETKDPPPSM